MDGRRLRIRHVVALGASVWAATGFYRVGPSQRGVVQVFGRAGASVGSGPHWTWPWPIGRVTRIEGDRVRSVQLGVSAIETLTGRRPSDARTQYMTGDQGLVQILVRAQYTVRDDRAYLFAVTPAVAEQMVRAAVQSELTAGVSRQPWDELLRDPTRRTQVLTRARAEAQKQLDRNGVGVSLEAVSLVAFQPPGPVVGAFNDVLSAQSEANATVRQAESEAAQAIQSAQGRARQTQHEAQAHANRLIALARAELEDFPRRAAEFRAARAVTGKRLFLEMVQEVLPNVRKIVVPRDAEGRSIDLSIVEPSP